MSEEGRQGVERRERFAQKIRDHYGSARRSLRELQRIRANVNDEDGVPPIAKGSKKEGSMNKFQAVTDIEPVSRRPLQIHPDEPYRDYDTVDVAAWGLEGVVHERGQRVYKVPTRTQRAPTPDEDLVCCEQRADCELT